MNETAVDFVFNHLKANHPEVFKALLENDIYSVSKEKEREIIVEAAVYDPFLGNHPKLVGVDYYKKYFGQIEK
jgi:hypothetical protein